MKLRPICKNKEFSRVYSRGKSFVTPQVVVYVLKNRCGHTRYGLTATKKVGKAVARNRARRVMRAALTAVLPRDVGSWDIILVARALTPKIKSTKLEKTLRKTFEKAGFPVLPGAVPPGKVEE